MTLLEWFDLDPTKRCVTYSKGNRQKGALIAGFVSDVALYVLDEPTSGLDPLMESVFQDLVPLVILTVVATVLHAVGITGLRRRDLVISA